MASKSRQAVANSYHYRTVATAIAVAGGKKTRSELNGVGEEEFAPWSIGPTL